MAIVSADDNPVTDPKLTTLIRAVRNTDSHFFRAGMSDFGAITKPSKESID